MAAATHQARCMKASPPRLRISRISSVAYATEDSGSLQNTGMASRLGSSVSPSWLLRIARPTITRLGARHAVAVIGDRRELEASCLQATWLRGRSVRSICGLDGAQRRFDAVLTGGPGAASL